MVGLELAYSHKMATPSTVVAVAMRSYIPSSHHNLDPLKTSDLSLPIGRCHLTHQALQDHCS